MTLKTGEIAMSVQVHDGQGKKSVGKRTWLAVILVALCLPPAAALAATCRVTTAGTSAGTGTWASPMDLQTALATSTCTEIWVAAGVYTPTVANGVRGISFNIEPGVAAYGGFAGTETARSQRDPAANVTILSGDLNGDDGANFANNGDNSYHVVTMGGGGTPVTAATVLDGFTIRGGNADGSAFPANAGGGLYCNGVGNGNQCSPTLGKLIFSGNNASYGGGALYDNGYNQGTSSPTLRDIAFRDNHGGTVGGAMYNDGTNGTSSPNLNNVTFSNNSAANGGAMMNDGNGGTSSPSMGNITFSGNSADNVGGAMFNRGVNGGTSSPGMGNVTFSGNRASYGGALANDGFNGNSQPALVNVILWGNTLSIPGGNSQEIYNVNATPIIVHSIVQGSGGSGSWDSSLGTDGGNNLDTDPVLGALADNGGTTPTLLPGAGSAAIDAGTCSGAPSADQRGVPRPQGGNCDIGAVEVRQAQLSVIVGANGSVTASASAALIGTGIGACSNTTCTAAYDIETNSPAITLAANPSAHYHVVWSGDCTDNGNGTASVSMAADRVCTASFAIDSYTLSYTAGANGSISGTSPQSVPYGGDGSTVTAVADAHYHFVQWSDGLTTAARTDTKVGADLDVTASFAIDSFAVVGTVGRGSGNIAPASQNVAYGQTATFSLSPDAHYHLDGIGSTCGGNLGGNSYTTGAVTADCVVTVNFALDSYTITGAVSGGHGSISPTSLIGNYGDTPSFTLTPDAFYHVASVSGCGGALNGNSYTVAPISGPCTVNATFAQTIAPYTPVPTLDWRMLLLLAVCMSVLGAWRLRGASASRTRAAGACHE